MRFASMQSDLAGIETKAALLFFRTMTLETFRLENRADLTEKIDRAADDR